jgi:demethylmenaquinone methyltransferase/2-methoxy-6-polyprenyl-1,4-benzoquinol methylase
VSAAAESDTLASYYARRAAEYERIYEKPERQDDLRALRRLVEDRTAGQDVFELACGTGYWTQFAAPRARSIVATDINEETLAIARSKDIKGETAFVQADAYALPDFGRELSAGLAAFWWSHVPKARLAEFLRAYHRLFAPGARLVFIDNRYVEGSSTPIARTDAAGNTYQTRRLADGSEHEVLKNFPEERELLAAVGGAAQEAGVELLRHYWILSYTLPA